MNQINSSRLSRTAILQGRVLFSNGFLLPAVSESGRSQLASLLFLDFVSVTH
jgi:hypothetical protein